MAYQQQYDGYPQQRQQQYYQEEAPSQRQQHPRYDDHYDQQQYDYGYDQAGHEQWDNSYYDQQQGGWGNAQQQNNYHEGNAHARQPPQGQGRRLPPQGHYSQEQAYDEQYQQQQRSPQRRQDPRSRPSGRGNGLPSNPQQQRGGLRPPGLDRSLFNSAPHKNLPLDNPFPTFPTQRAKQAASKDTLSQGMSQMNINGAEGQGRPNGMPGRGQPMPPQSRGPPQSRPEQNSRQDSGHFEGSGHNQRGPSNRMPPNQRQPPMNIDTARGVPPQRQSDPKSPSQRAFGPNTQRSMTMPQQLPGGGQGGAYEGQQQWSESAGTGYSDPASPTYAPPRPSTAGGVRQNRPQEQHQRPPMPQSPPQHQQHKAPPQQQQHQAPPQQQQYHADLQQQQHQPPAQTQQQYQSPAQQQQQQQYLVPPQQQQRRPHLQGQDEEGGALDTFYDDYYGDSSDRKSMASTIDMPNFDAIPENSTRHRRGDSIDNHLSPNAGPNRSVVPAPSSIDNNATYGNNDFQQQASRSRSQPNLHDQYATDAFEMAGDVPPIPTLPRSNTGFDRSNGLPNGPRGQGLPPRGMTTDGTQRAPNQGYAPEQPANFDPRYAQHPPQVQRGYSGDSAYSEPPLNTMRSVSSPIGSGNPIPRPGTAGPAAGRMNSDPMGRRPGTTQPQSNPDALPAHPAPVRAGLQQQQHQHQHQQQPQQHQQQQQASASQSVRPAPIRQYNSEPARTSYEGQQSVAQRRSSIPHPVTFDELNRLRNTWKANPADNATGITLAKKLVEAASVLADEGGTADTRTRNKNREKFILEAHKIIKKLVAAGSPDAMFYLADCYGQGLLGLQPDTKEAFALYQSAAKAGHAASAYRTAVCCEMGHEKDGGTKRDPLKAVQWYRRAAALGDTPALYKMGMILLKGLLGQQKNFGEAINMLKRAAERADRDNPHALHELGLIYDASTGNERIIRDEAYALQLFHQAADLGYKFSQFKLGQAYEYGLIGCQIDARTSIAWYTKSAAQEEHQSELALSGWYLTGIQGVLEQSDTEAYLWARKAACAEPPLPKALFAMGYFTEVGIGCPRSLDEAKRWYGRAAAYKFPKAQERLEELKRGGSKVQMKRERLSRTNQKQQEENCVVM